MPKLIVSVWFFRGWVAGKRTEQPPPTSLSFLPSKNPWRKTTSAYNSARECESGRGTPEPTLTLPEHSKATALPVNKVWWLILRQDLEPCRKEIGFQTCSGGLATLVERQKHWEGQVSSHTRKHNSRWRENVLQRTVLFLPRSVQDINKNMKKNEKESTRNNSCQEAESREWLQSNGILRAAPCLFDKLEVEGKETHWKSINGTEKRFKIKLMSESTSEEVGRGQS